MGAAGSGSCEFNLNVGRRRIQSRGTPRGAEFRVNGRLVCRADRGTRRVLAPDFKTKAVISLRGLD